MDAYEVIGICMSDKKAKHCNVLAMHTRHLHLESLVSLGSDKAGKAGFLGGTYSSAQINVNIHGVPMHKIVLCELLPVDNADKSVSGS